MSLQCRRECCPSKDLDKMLFRSVRKIGELRHVQSALLLENPVFDVLMPQLKSLEISDRVLPYHMRVMKQSIREEVPHRIVFRFVNQIVEPFVIHHFTSNVDRRILIQNLKHFIGMRYGASISTHLVCRNFTKVPGDEGVVRHALSHAIVYTLVAGVAASVLHTYFRWCECKSEVPTVVYYFKCGWNKLTARVISGLLSTTTLAPLDEKQLDTVLTEACRFEPLLPKHVDPLKQPYVVVPSCARFVLKPNSQRFRLVINAGCTRPIAALVTKDTKLSNIGRCERYTPISINQRLKYFNGLFEFLQRLRSELPSVYAPSMLSVGAAFDTLVSFRSAAYASGMTRFWLAKLDLLDCFHRIDHERLMTVFIDVCSLAEKFIYPKPDTEHLKNELAWFMTNAIVLLQRKPFVFKHGIPQGSCVSSDLANLYLAHADRVLQRSLNLWTPKSVVQETDMLVLRYLDDYLCVAASSEALSHLVGKLRQNMNTYGLTFNESKVQSNTENFNTSVCWLGMEIRNNLSIIIPESRPSIFCRFAGQPLSAEECITRLRCSRLQRASWRYAFRVMPSAARKPSEFGRCTNGSSPVLALNACRLGMQLADLFWITVKTSPERKHLLHSTMAKRLACIVRSKLYSVVGPRQWRLQRLARNAFIQHLRSHRGELIHVFRALRVSPWSTTKANERFVLQPIGSAGPLVHDS